MKFSEIIYKYVPFDWIESHYSHSRRVQTNNYPIWELRKVKQSIMEQLTSFEKIENPYLYGQYLLRMWEYTKNGIYFTERNLFHLTNSDKIENIKKTNFNYRYTIRSKYGDGVSFSTHPWYARYITYRPTHYSHLFVVKVLVGRGHEGQEDQTLPAIGYDTTLGNHQVVVKFYDNEFYPFALFDVPGSQYFKN